MENHGMSHSTSRREFIQTTLAAGAVAAGGILPALEASAMRLRRDNKPMRILILGGTGFIGPALVEVALANGHRVSVFNRGITEKRKGALPDHVERLVGDRDP